jgi:flagellar biosynthetic protein FlhB
MADENGLERSESPTPRRLEDARERGQVARSRELNAVVVLSAGVGALLASGQALVEGLARQLRTGLGVWPAQVRDSGVLYAALVEALRDGLLLLAPFLVATLVATLAGPLLLGGWTFAPGTMVPDPARLNPVAGMGRVFSLHGFMESVKALAKFLLLGLAAYLLVTHLLPVLAQAGTASPPAGIGAVAGAVRLGVLVLCGVMAVIAAVDAPVQIWRHGRQLRMTKQEVRDELKETEGRPEVRSRVRKLQRELTRNRMLAEVPRASVVIVNPVHYAVALRYRQDRDRAPVVVARGADLLARRIRDVALQARVPVVGAPAVARALYRSTRVNQQIPAPLYVAVARILAYVHRLHVDGAAVAPEPDELPVPPGFGHG